MTRRPLLLVARGVTSIALLGVLSLVLEPREVLGRLTRMDPAWVAGAFLLSVAQVVASAWRWRFTAARLGLELPMSRAIFEYYLATFLNQVLPGGVVGDVSRAWRHAREAEARASVQSVAFERLSGLIVMSAVAAVSALLLFEDVSAGAKTALLILVLALIVWGFVGARRARSGPGSSEVVRNLRKALLDGPALPIQLITSLAVVSSYIAIFVMAGQAIQLDTSVTLLAMLAGPLLMSMLVPVTIAGWGLREVAAAALWSAAGLTAADGVAISVSYGLLVLASSLPGTAVLGLTLLRGGDPDRTARPSPAGSDGRVAAAPRSESESRGV